MVFRRGPATELVINVALFLTSGTEDDPAVIHIAPGQYNAESGEIFPLEFKSHTILTGGSSDDTVIDGTGFEASVIKCEEVIDITVENVTLTGGTGTLGLSG